MTVHQQPPFLLFRRIGVPIPAFEKAWPLLMPTPVPSATPEFKPPRGGRGPGGGAPGW